jgi:hypothetical protein
MNAYINNLSLLKMHVKAGFLVVNDYWVSYWKGTTIYNDYEVYL